MKNIKVKFKNRLQDDCWGLAFRDEHRIEIKNGLEPFDEFDTTIHELLHIVYPFLEEVYVEKYSTILAKELWKLGYRRQK